MSSCDSTSMWQVPKGDNACFGKCYCFYCWWKTWMVIVLANSNNEKQIFFDIFLDLPHLLKRSLLIKSVKNNIIFALLLDHLQWGLERSLHLFFVMEVHSQKRCIQMEQQTWIVFLIVAEVMFILWNSMLMEGCLPLSCRATANDVSLLRCIWRTSGFWVKIHYHGRSTLDALGGILQE